MKKIIIIEDDPIVSRIYQNRLEKEGCEVEIATDGQSGFYRIHEARPDAVLLDLMLPKMNGVDLLKKIRAQAPFQKTPILVFTNAYVPNMIQEAFQAGATQVFNKATLTPRQVIDALQTAMYLTGGGAPPSAAAQSTTAASHSVPQSSEPESVSVVQPNKQPSTPTQAKASTEETFKKDVRKTFQESAPEILSTIRNLMKDFTKATNDASRMPCLMEMYRKVHALTGGAGIAGLHCISQMAAALEVLLRELHEKPKNINASTMRTVAHAIDFTTELFTRGVTDNEILAAPINILVVDDEILSRRAITYALEKAGLKSASIEDPQTALEMATETAYDLIFLDVQMPGMDGFDLCTKIRSEDKNKTTPVVFVTCLTDFKNRARSSLSGGTDLIAKPFMFMELSVKALTYVLRGRLAKRSAQTTPGQEAAA